MECIQLLPLLHSNSRFVLCWEFRDMTSKNGIIPKFNFHRISNINDNSFSEKTRCSAIYVAFRLGLSNSSLQGHPIVNCTRDIYLEKRSPLRWIRVHSASGPFHLIFLLFLIKFDGPLLKYIVSNVFLFWFSETRNIYFIDLPSNPLIADEQIIAQHTNIDWEISSPVEVTHSDHHLTADISNASSMANILYSNFNI